MDTKSSDKKQTLLHYVVHSVTKNFPEVLDFEAGLTFLEKAAAGNKIF